MLPDLTKWQNVESHKSERRGTFTLGMVFVGVVEMVGEELPSWIQPGWKEVGADNQEPGLRGLRACHSDNKITWLPLSPSLGNHFGWLGILINWKSGEHWMRSGTIELNRINYLVKKMTDTQAKFCLCNFRTKMYERKIESWKCI